jgi:hypothetical protein
MESKADLDIGTAIFRHNDLPFDRLVFVAGSEQQYHFKVLFTILAKLGFGWAENLYHLSYGMVNLPEGRMKSREGTVVDADDLIDSLKDTGFQPLLPRLPHPRYSGTGVRGSPALSVPKIRGTSGLLVKKGNIEEVYNTDVISKSGGPAGP